MKTITTTVPGTGSRTVGSRRPSRLRRLVTAFVLAVLSLVGAVAGTAATAPTASADTVTSVATVCFEQSDGGAYTGPTMMYVYLDDAWHYLSTMPGTNSGCETWATPDNLNIQFVVNYTLDQSTWTGASDVYYNPPGQTSHFGTYAVKWRVR